MKKTLFSAMLAAALMGSPLSAGTIWVGGHDGTYSNPPSQVYGTGSLLIKEATDSEYARLGEVAGDFGNSAPVSDAGVTMEGGTVDQLSAGVSLWESANNNAATISGGSAGALYAGYAMPDAEGGSANGNKAVMTGGWAGTLCAGCVEADAGGIHIDNNLVLVTGGSSSHIYGALNVGGSVGANASRNKVYITGMDQESAASVYAACGGTDSVMKNNQVHLVGAGGEVVVDREIRSGSAFSVGDVVAASCSGTIDASGNSIDIYGNGIAAHSLGAMQQLNFHVARAQLENGAAPMVTLTEAPLNLTGFLVPTTGNPNPALALTFDAMSSMQWAPGTSVTLVSSALGITIDPSLLNREYKIYNSGSILQEEVATATLKLEQGQGTTQFLRLVVPRVPEPATGTLSLLALAALAARRRK